jgi:hypothetical protein
LPLGSATWYPACPSAAYKLSVGGSPKCRKRPVPANQVIAAAASPSSVSTNSPRGRAIAARCVREVAGERRLGVGPGGHDTQRRAALLFPPTQEGVDWNNSTVLKGDVVEEVSKLKQELDGEIVVPASYQLGRTLIEHDLVDELRLVVFPVVLGAGERLFGEASDKKPMRLVDTKTIGDGLVFLTYEFVREA